MLSKRKERNVNPKYLKVPSRTTFETDFIEKKLLTEDEENSPFFQKNTEDDEDFDLSNQIIIDQFESYISYVDYDRSDITQHLEKAFNHCNCPSKTNEPFNSESESEDNTIIEPTQVISKEIVPNIVLLIKKKKEKVVEDRKDYLIKQIKTRVGKYFIQILNSKCKNKFHFYLPDSKKFTRNSNITKNKKWFTWSIKQILLKYDKKTKKSNKSIISKMELDPRNFNDILIILSKTYEELIIDYFNSEKFEKDVNKFDQERREKFISFCGTDKDCFIYYIKNTKGNTKKSN